MQLTKSDIENMGLNRYLNKNIYTLIILFAFLVLGVIMTVVVADYAKPESNKYEMVNNGIVITASVNEEELIINDIVYSKQTSAINEESLGIVIIGAFLIILSFSGISYYMIKGLYTEGSRFYNDWVENGLPLEINKKEGVGN